MLIDCGECGEKVSDKAEKCPKCGWPTWYALPWYDRVMNPRGWEKREGIFLRTMNALTSLVLIVIGLFALLMFAAANGK